MEAKPPDTKKPIIHWGWWLLLIALAVWSIWALWPDNQSGLELPYTSFLDQVRAGNVTRVAIVGNRITGEFLQAVPKPQDPASSAASSQGPVTYSQFQANFPDMVGDPGLIALLDAHQVQVEVAPPPNPWFTILLTDGFPLLLLFLVLFWMGRQALRNQAGLFNFGRSHGANFGPRRQVASERPEVSFEDVAGAGEAKQELKEVVDFLKNPQKYHDLGAHIPRGVLLVGPPGTGKTLLARAVAGEAHVPFFSIRASEFVEMFVGVGASRVRDLFTQARGAGPAIIFIDELEAVGRRRGTGLGSVNDEREQTLNQLLVEMDGFEARHEIILLAATNRPDVLDLALLRPGRFDRQIMVSLPDRRGREGILRIHTRPLRLALDVDLNLLARTTTGLSGADLANLCNEAALIAAREIHSQTGMSDFEEALDRILLGAAGTLLLNDEERRVIAYHEAGHALVAWLTPYADPVHKVTIIPRGRALGVTEQVPGDDRYNYSRSSLLARIAVLLGGRAAEELATGDVTTGAENDLVEATRLARRMITRWGMGSLGPMALDTNEERPFLGYELAQGRAYSEETAARIDQDVQKLLADRYQEVHHLLENARSKLDSLVSILLKEESIDRESLVRILGPRLPVKTIPGIPQEISV